MNNQAAQAMPPVPQAFFDEFGVNADDRVMDYGRACYAAALSQTAGVAEPGRYFADGPQGHFFADDLKLARDLVNLYDKDDDWTITDLRNPTGVAPAASGGEDDMCPNCVTPWKCNGPHESTGGASVSGGEDGPIFHLRSHGDVTAEELKTLTAPTPTSAASVSERAREYRHSTHHVNRGPESLPCYCAATSDHLVGEEASNGEALARRFHEAYERLAPSFGYETRTETRQFDPTTPNGRLMIAVCSELALEQALTQQRGEAVYLIRGEFGGWSQTTKESYEWWDGKCAEQDRRILYTTPQPSADAVREYVTELRAQADQKMGVAGACAHDGDRARYKSAAQLLRRVADELESLLSAASGEKGVDDTKRLDWIARQGGYEFDFGILNDQPGDGDWFVHGMVGSGQGATFRDAIDAAIKEEAGGQDANTDILDTLAFKTENGDAGRGSVTYIALVASGEADHQQNAAQGGGAS